MLKIRIEKIIGFGYFNFNMDNVTKNISYFSIRANYTYSNFFFPCREQKIIPKEDNYS